MEIKETRPPRAFMVGLRGTVAMREVAKIGLEPGEIVTFLGEAGVEYDIARKEWGFYATPSLNHRLPKFGLRPALVKNPQERWFLVLIEKSNEAQRMFREYCEREQLRVSGWLDNETTLKKIDEALWGK